jgi:hypothetical protein
MSQRVSRKEEAEKPSQAPPNPAARNLQKVHMQDKGSRLAVLTPTHIGQTSAARLKRLRLRALHCSALNHLTADASSRKL